MESGTRAIVELAWARALGLRDDALHDDAHDVDVAGRLTRVDDATASFVTLWQHRVLLGPAWLLERARGVDDEVLASGSGLLGLTREPPSGAGPGQLLGESVLAFTDGYVERDGLEAAVVGDDPQAVADLERECPPDDVTEVGLSARSARFVLLDDREAPTSGAGYDEWQGILAHLGVLTPPALRRSGYGTLVGAIATNDALDAGLVAQWRCARTNEAALALGRRLGYEAVGTQTTVVMRA